jgi:addiction module RelB/DinJ family antitoxin
VYTSVVMNSTVINVKTDPKLKAQAQKLASELGLSLSAVINAGLKKFVSDKQINLSAGYEPSEYLKEILEQVEAGKGERLSFDSTDEALAFLD